MKIEITITYKGMKLVEKGKLNFIVVKSNNCLYDISLFTLLFLFCLMQCFFFNF